MKPAMGFTLMEVLVALVLLTLFTLVTYRALDSVLQAQQRAGAEMARWRGLAAAFVRLESDLSNAVARLDPREPAGGTFRTRNETGGAMQFELVRQLPEDMDEGVQRIGYRCEGDSLVRLIWAEAADNGQAPQAIPLLKDLSACSFRYMGINGEWLNAWLPQARQPLPKAVELNLVEAGGTPLRRVWRVQ